MTRIENLEDWVAKKRREVDDERPLSIQANIAVLSQRLWKAEPTLEQVRRWVDDSRDMSEPHESNRSDWLRGYLKARNDVARILDGGAE